MRAVRNYRGVGVAEALAGAQLTDAVCKYLWKLHVFNMHQAESHRQSLLMGTP